MLKNGKHAPGHRERGPMNGGAYLLGRLGLPDAEIAARVGCSRAQITNYRACKLRPRHGNRVGLQREFGIPAETWDRPHVPMALVPAPPRAENGGGAIAPADVHAMVAGGLDALLRSINSPESGATPNEQLRVFKSATETLKNLGKLTGDTVVLTEARILRLPAWAALKRKILDALRPWPEAIHAVGKALGEQNGDES